VITGDFLYALLRLGLAVIGAVGWAWIVRLAIPAARRADTSERRVRMVTIVFMLAELAVLLALTALWDWDRPPPTDSFLAVLGMAIRASVSLSAVVLIWTWPDDEAGR
jgi:drug/metabolite transporter (DMT)-like permease